MGSCGVCGNGEACLGTTGTEAHLSCACHGALLWVNALSWHRQVGRYNQQKQNYEGWPLMNCWDCARPSTCCAAALPTRQWQNSCARSTTSLTLRGTLWLIPSWFLSCCKCMVLQYLQSSPVTAAKGRVKSFCISTCAYHSIASLATKNARGR